MSPSSIVTIRMPQGTPKQVDLSEVDGWRNGVKLEQVINRAFLNGWDDARLYYVNDRTANKSTLLFGGESVTVAKRHDNG